MEKKLSLINKIPEGYKQTELGVIPEDWNIKELRSLVDANRNIRYGIVQPGIFDPQGRYMVRGQDYSFGWVDEQFLFKVSPKIEERYRNARLKSTDVILTIVGAGTGHLEIVPNWLEGANITQTTARIAIEKTKSDERYCKYFFQSPVGQKEIRNYIKGNAQPGLNIKDVKIFKLALPSSKSEQTAIATVLSDTDALIEQLEKLIAKKKAIKQGTMQQLLTGKKRLPGFSGEWEVKKVGDIFSISAGGDLIKEYYSQTKDDKYCYPIYSNSLTNKGLYGFSKLYRHDENCITVTARGTIGAANVRDHKFDAIGRVLILRPLCELNCFFISEYLNNRVAFSIESTGVPQLTAPQISKYEIIFPGYIEQNTIATVLSDMDAEIESLEQKGDKYTMLKQGMMQQLLTGRIRIYANN